jgi:FkbM family methyltransferase
MSIIENAISLVRRQVNRRLKLDVVRVSGQYTLPAHVVTVMEKYSVDAIIDVGANQGSFGSLMRSVGFRGPIYSFEPVTAAFDVLAERAKKDDSWRVFNFALGAQAGEAQINVSKDSQFSSILNATNYGNTWENMKVEQKQDIVIRTLDDCFGQGLLDQGTRFFLKMDTQGFDMEVFNGASCFLAKVCCMQSELSLIPLYQGMPSYLESLARYKEEGFLASGIYPITRNKYLALNEVDCILVRPEFLGLGSNSPIAGH